MYSKDMFQYVWYFFWKIPRWVGFPPLDDLTRMTLRQSGYHDDLHLLFLNIKNSFDFAQHFSPKKTLFHCSPFCGKKTFVRLPVFLP